MTTKIDLAHQATGILPASDMPALTGDVTSSSGTVATTIASNAVTTAKINNSAVTLAKVANASANSVLVGSGAAGSGAAYSEIALGTNLSMSGTTLNSSGGGGVNIYPGVPASGTIPDMSGWTVVNSGVLVSQNGGAGNPALIKVTNNASANWRALKTTLPSAPYSIIFRLSAAVSFANSSAVGLYFFDGSNKMAGIEMLYQSSAGTPQVRVHKGTNPTTDSSDTPAAAGFPTANGYLALAQDTSSTNQIYYYSLDGVNWIQLLSEATGTFMTPTGIGIGGAGVNTGVDVYISANYFRQTANSTCT